MLKKKHGNGLNFRIQHQYLHPNFCDFFLFTQNKGGGGAPLDPPLQNTVGSATNGNKDTQTTGTSHVYSFFNFEVNRKSSRCQEIVLNRLLYLY